MNSADRRKAIMGGCVVLLLAVVGADQLGLFGGGSQAAADIEPGSRERYLMESQSLAEMRGELAQREKTASALADAKAQWAMASEMMIRASTVQLAEAQFRDRVLDALNEIGVDSPRVSSAPRRSASDAGSQIESIALEVHFAAQSQDAIFRTIDRLENMPEVRTNVQRVTIKGTGRKQISEPIDVQLRLSSLANIGERAGDG